MVLKSQKMVLKLYNSERQAEDIYNQMSVAHLQYNLPVCAFTVITYTYEENLYYALKADRARGYFFQLSKAGHLAGFLEMLNKIDDHYTLQRIFSAFKAATNCKLQDAQFFLDLESRWQPITFIDIHVNLKLKSASVTLMEICQTLAGIIENNRK